MKRKQMFCGALALCLVLSLTPLPAGTAQESGLVASADQAAELAMQYGQADSVQYALWRTRAIILTGHRGITPVLRTGHSPTRSSTAWGR
ncbi:MAG: hypothetical protein ACLU9S_05470 [Oscillospiraceae bacterium]